MDNAIFLMMETDSCIKLINLKNITEIDYDKSQYQLYIGFIRNGYDYDLREAKIKEMEIIYEDELIPNIKKMIRCIKKKIREDKEYELLGEKA